MAEFKTLQNATICIDVDSIKAISFRQSGWSNISCSGLPAAIPINGDVTELFDKLHKAGVVDLLHL